MKNILLIFTTLFCVFTSNSQIFYPTKKRIKNIGIIDSIVQTINHEIAYSLTPQVFFFDKTRLSDSRNSIRKFANQLLKAKENNDSFKLSQTRLTCYRGATDIMIQKVDSLILWFEMGKPNAPKNGISQPDATYQDQIDAGISIPCCDYFNWIQQYIFLVKNINKSLLNSDEKPFFQLKSIPDQFNCNYKDSFNPTKN